jgi:lysophospholipase L1-like esterase
MPSKNGIVFVGSSSIVLWKTLASDFPDHQIINRGFGGSQISDSIRVYDRIITKYEPKMVVFFAGTNDLAAGKSADTVVSDFKRLTQKIHNSLPKTRIAFISISPAPSRKKLFSQMQYANKHIREYCLQDPRLAFIDVFTLMLSPKGEPRPELFGPDQLHMNDQGYEIWRRAVRPYLPWN